jgi:hypothetical protein
MNFLPKAIPICNNQQNYYYKEDNCHSFFMRLFFDKFIKSFTINLSMNKPLGHKLFN